MTAIIDIIRRELVRNSDEQTRRSGQNFFKEKIKLHGVKTAIVAKIAKEHFKTVKDRPKSEIFALCGELWQSGYLEESFVACNWSYYLHKDYQPEDFKVFEYWVANFVNNWASCDTLCNHTVGAFVAMYPEYLAELKNGPNPKTAGCAGLLP